MKNKKGQVYGGLIDASTISHWLLYPLLIIIMIVLLFSVVLMGIYAYSCLVKDKCFMPFGLYGYGGWGFPIGVISSQTQINDYSECFVNGVKVNCTRGFG